MGTLDGKYSSFPNGVDSFNEVFDLPPGKFDSAARLAELKTKPSLDNAEQDEVVRLTNELHMYMISPQTWNKFGSALYAVQKFFNDNVRGFIEQKQAEWKTYVNNFNHVGTWVAGKNYKYQNMVTDAKGDLYISKADHVSVAGKSPDSNAAQWSKISSKGDKGDIGLNANYRGDWNNGTAYSMGDAVSFQNYGTSGGTVYIAKRSNTGKSPHSNPDDWLLYHQLVYGKVEPVNAGLGTHYIEVVD